MRRTVQLSLLFPFKRFDFGGASKSPRLLGDLSNFAKAPGSFCELAHQAQLAPSEITLRKEPLEEQEMWIQSDATFPRT